MVGGFNRLIGIMRTVYNQYDSLVRPLRKWLDDRGVVFETGTKAVDLDLVRRDGGDAIMGIVIEEQDYVLVTLGSVTEASTLGGMDSVPVLQGKAYGGAWLLWQYIAAGRDDVGRPSVFADHIDQSKWVPFTTTLDNPTFL